VRPDNFPAPGDYNPEKAEKVIHEHSPQYTFGLKTQVDKPNPNPAPNVYNIPTVMGAAKEGHFKAAPSFSISGRTKEFPDGRLLNPGPGAYNDVSADSIKPKSPAYTVSARYNIPGDSSPRPGPGAYSPEKVSRAYPVLCTTTRRGGSKRDLGSTPPPPKISKKSLIVNIKITKKNILLYRKCPENK